MEILGNLAFLRNFFSLWFCGNAGFGWYDLEITGKWKNYHFHPEERHPEREIQWNTKSKRDKKGECVCMGTHVRNDESWETERKGASFNSRLETEHGASWSRRVLHFKLYLHEHYSMVEDTTDCSDRGLKPMNLNSFISTSSRGSVSPERAGLKSVTPESK